MKLIKLVDNLNYKCGFVIVNPEHISFVLPFDLDLKKSLLIVRYGLPENFIKTFEFGISPDDLSSRINQLSN